MFYTMLKKVTKYDHDWSCYKFLGLDADQEAWLRNAPLLVFFLSFSFSKSQEIQWKKIALIFPYLTAC